MAMQTTDLINQFFNQERFAMVGVSRNSRDFSRTLFREFIQRGRDVLPVNSKAVMLDGKKAYASIRDVWPPVKGALLMTSPEGTLRALQECFEAGVTMVWVYGIVGPKKISPEVLSYCEEHGIGVIPGYCPYMFLPGAETFHRFHRWAWKLLGYYPRNAGTTAEPAP